jgi:hypothetical protein
MKRKGIKLSTEEWQNGTEIKIVDVAANRDEGNRKKNKRKH